MSGPKYLLDTTIVLYILSGNETLANHLHRKSLYASFISEIELFSFRGLSSKEEKTYVSFWRSSGLSTSIKASSRRPFRCEGVTP